MTCMAALLTALRMVGCACLLWAAVIGGTCKQVPRVCKWPLDHRRTASRVVKVSPAMDLPKPVIFPSRPVWLSFFC
ncbi:hypothetical protein B0H67DRAFT_307999 [Lasiosphaeris hirsuta]|uniref:Secreted protein n=1 Tax=Lasiosphaeris hirsuta TaxID=260670 RepID=A0AA40DN56_9PEZI|nr:hypothetical protein B0H67DRAFT_307999 [Lasiosphaeris hirsuta]